MKSSEQTEELKVRLYDLTLMFTKKYVWQYYKQYTGQVEDLAMDYYLEFLTPKSRVKGKEETLLDKFDEKITSLEYLVKVAVKRKLIDSSRQNPFNNIRIDNYTDEFGDCKSAAFDLVTDPDEAVGHIEDFRTFTKSEALFLKGKFEAMAEAAKAQFVESFQLVKNVISPSYRDLFDFIVGDSKVAEPAESEEGVLLEVLNSILGLKSTCEVQQVTPKTVCIFISDQTIDFDLS